MKRWFILFLLFLSIGFLSGCSLFPSRKKAALSIKTIPKATIFLDGEHLGQTPYYNDKLKSGEYILKIVPESSGQTLTVWEGRLTLTPGILTVVNRELGLTQDDSSGEILSFELLGDKNAVSMAIVTTPDGAVVNLDGEPRGYAPLSIDDFTEGDHVLVITSPGYKEKTIKTKTVKGHKLITSVQLSREIAAVETREEKEATESAESSSQSDLPATSKSSPSGEIKRPYVEINSPNIGWVRVREEPSTATDNEITKVDHGEQFPLLDSNESGWYQIEYETGKEGWISGRYAEKYL